MSSSKSSADKRRAASVKRAPKAATARTAKQAATPPQATVAADSVATQMLATAKAIEQAIATADLGSLPNESLQKLMAATVKAYSAKREAGENFLPVNTAGRVTPTDIMVTSSQLLRAGNLQVFELGMWQSWTGN